MDVDMWCHLYFIDMEGEKGVDVVWDEDEMFSSSWARLVFCFKIRNPWERAGWLALMSGRN
jgi:hypothetical protein